MIQLEMKQRWSLTHSVKRQMRCVFTIDHKMADDVTSEEISFAWYLESFPTWIAFFLFKRRKKSSEFQQVTIFVYLSYLILSILYANKQSWRCTRKFGCFDKYYVSSLELFRCEWWLSVHDTYLWTIKIKSPCSSLSWFPGNSHVLFLCKPSLIG